LFCYIRKYVIILGGIFPLTSPQPKNWGGVCVPGIPGGVDASEYCPASGSPVCRRIVRGRWKCTPHCRPLGQSHCIVACWEEFEVTRTTGVAGGGRGPHRAALASGGERAKIVFKNSRENSDRIISYVFACNKNKALQLQRVPVLSILGCSIDLYVKQAHPQFPKPKTKGRQI